jgi:hypothetical protein
MSCPSCTSGNQAEFATEMNVHLSSLENVDKATVLLFSNLVVCLDCGFSRFTMPKAELAKLGTGDAPIETFRPIEY